MNPLVSMILGAVVRHAVSVAGASLAANGVASANDVQTTVGVLAALASFGWSTFQKFRAHQATQ